MFKKTNPYTDETALKEILKYPDRKSVMEKDSQLYNYVRYRHIDKIAFAHMVNHRFDRKYTDEQLREEAKKYTMRERFRQGSPKMYEAARDRGILDDICSHMERVYKDYTFEQCQQAALKYKTRNKFLTSDDRNLAAYAQNHGWYEEICAHMPKPNYVIQHDWTPDACAKEAKNYGTRTEFEKGNGSAYQAARRLGILDEICKHMKPKNCRLQRCIYAAEFDDNHVYVGLTYDVEKRWAKETSSKRETVFRYIQKTGLNPLFKIVHHHEPALIAKELEGKYMEKYKNGGWILLNRAKPGGLGGADARTLEECIEIAKKCVSYKDFWKNHQTIHSYCTKHKWIDKIKQVLPPVFKNWTDEELVELARPYKSRKKFIEENSAAHQIIWRRNLQPLAYGHMEDYINRVEKRTKEECAEEAKKYNTRRDFAVGSPSHYHRARKDGYLDEICAHMPKRASTHYRWKDKEAIAKAALQCDTRSHFKKKFFQAYQEAHRLGIIDEVCAHMPKPNNRKKS